MQREEHEKRRQQLKQELERLQQSETADAERVQQIQQDLQQMRDDDQVKLQKWRDLGREWQGLDAEVKRAGRERTPEEQKRYNECLSECRKLSKDLLAAGVLVMRQ